MKQVILIVCIIAVIAAGIFVEQRVIKTTFDELGEKIASCIETEKSRPAADEVIEVYGWWKEKKRVLHAIIPHNDIRELESHFSLAKVYATEADNIDALCELEAILDLAVSVPKTYRFAFENVL